MEAILAPWIFVFLLIFGPLIALNAYLFVWLCGPAIRRAGRRWEEGRLKAIEAAMDRKSQALLQDSIDILVGARRPDTLPAAPVTDQTSINPDVREKYTITGKLIR